MDKLRLVHWLFKREFIYNWTINPDNPGLIDFFIFLLKYGFLGFLFCIPFVPFDQVELALKIWAATMEEQALVFWIYNSSHKIKSGFKFALLLSFTEVLINGFRIENLTNFNEFYNYFLFRIPATIGHIFSAILIIILLKNKLRVTYVWIISVVIHFSYNEFISPLISCSDCTF